MKIYRAILVVAYAIGLLHSTPGLSQRATDGFDPNANNRADVVALQPDGKVMVAGIFSNIGGTNQAGLARLNPDGSVDTTFRPPQIFSGFAPVYAIAPQADGGLIIVGYFKTPPPYSRTNIARLLSDGSQDTNFVADTDNTATSVLIEPDGKILVGGFFQNVNGPTGDSFVWRVTERLIRTSLSLRTVSRQCSANLMAGLYSAVSSRTSVINRAGISPA